MKGSEGGPEGSLLRALVDLRDRQIQKARMQFGNRLRAIDQEADPSTDYQRQVLERYYHHFEELEAQLSSDIKDIVQDHPIYSELVSVKGVGPQLAAKLLALIDIERADTISALWRFAGLAVIDGEREKRVKGEKAHYSTRLKTAMYQVASSFLIHDSPYREVYDRARRDYESRDGWTKLHQHYAALRKMEKMFLSHLWLRWRSLEGLPITEPYAQAVVGHTNITRPEDYGWRSLAM